MEERKKIRVVCRGFSDGLQIPTSKAKSEKVDATVNTFLNGDNYNFQLSPAKVESGKKISTSVDKTFHGKTVFPN